MPSALTGPRSEPKERRAVDIRPTPDAATPADRWPVLAVLGNGTFARLFAAQAIALVGTGLLTVALGLLAFDIAGGNAGLVLGTALTLKMIAYVAVSPVMAAIAVRVSRKKLLMAADITRAVVALGLPFVTQTWQIYVLIFVLQSASATFTPAFQAVLPDVLPDERQYTRGLSLSRLAYDLESLLSPLIAAVLLTVVSYGNLFLGTVVGFVASAVLVLSTTFPADRVDRRSAPFVERLTSGTRVFWRTKELRSLLAMNLSVAMSTAMVVVNTVVLVQGLLGREQSQVAILLAAYGAGSMLVALVLPRVLDSVGDRGPMLVGVGSIPVLLVAGAAVIALPSGDRQWLALIALWFLQGAAISLVLTPSARLLRRASTEQNRPAVFAAQFSLSHVCYLIAYAAAGALGVIIGLAGTALVLAGAALVGAVVAASIRPAPIPA